MSKSSKAREKILSKQNNNSQGKKVKISNQDNDNSNNSIKTDNQIKQKSANQDLKDKKFPFWARLKIGKNRTTLVIDKDIVKDKKKNEMVEGFVHREATHTENKDFEKIDPNPDKDDKEPMYLKRPRKHPQNLFYPHNKNLDMPEHLKSRYEKNNKQ